MKKLSFIVFFILILVASSVLFRFGINGQAFFALVLSCGLLWLAFVDFKCQLLPDNITIPLLILGIIVNLASVFCAIQSAILGACIGYLSLRLVADVYYLLTNRIGMGGGDFKLLAVLGAWLGWQKLLFILIVASVCGLVGSMILIAIKRIKFDAAIPFGPYLAFGGWLGLMSGQNSLQFLI